MSRLRIAIVCPFYPWPPSIGGVETIVKNVSTELTQRGLETHVVTSTLSVTPMKKVTDFGVENRDGVIIHKLRSGRLRIGYARFLKELKNVIREIEPDTVHSHSLHPHLFQLAGWKDEFGYRLVAELHHPALTVDNTFAKLAFPFVSWRLRSTRTKIDGIIAHTSLEKNWLIKEGFSDSKVHEVFFPGIPQKLLNYEPRIVDGHSISFIGRIMKTKGLHILLQAMPRVTSDVHDASLIIAGPKDQNYYDHSLKRLVAASNLEKHVMFREPIFDDEKYDMLMKSALFVLPSLKEYTPNVLLEAQALGIPVVATRVGAVPEMMLDGETGQLVEPGNSLELAETIVASLLNNDARTRMAIKAKEFSKRFTLEEAVGKLEAIYDELVR